MKGKEMKKLLLFTSLFIVNCNPLTPPIRTFRGLDGYSVVHEVAPSGSCLNGGYNLLLATDTNRNGYVDSTDLNLESMTICNGTDGDDGEDAPPTQFSPIALIDPCGKTGSRDEVFLALADGSLLVSYSDNSNGDNTRFVLLLDGNYVTTDGTSCHFTKSGRTISWTGGSASW